MWQQGFLEEVRALQKKFHLDMNMPSMRTVGYRQVMEFLEKNSNTNDDLQIMKDKSLFATRQLAKRQYTWLRSLREKHNFVVYNSINDAKADLLNRYR
jgi:tRNA dimethylallyltransferase